MLTYARVCSRMRTCNAGTDCTEIFAASHSAQAWKDLEGFYLGDLLTDSADATELAAGAAGVLLHLLLRLLLHLLPFYAAFTAASLRCRACSSVSCSPCTRCMQVVRPQPRTVERRQQTTYLLVLRVVLQLQMLLCVYTDVC
jgi:hypothetical protein